MTRDQQAALEQVAREWFASKQMVVPFEEIESLVTLLAAQRATVLEEVAKRLEQEAEDWDEEIAGTFKEAVRIIRKQAQDQRP